MYWKQLRDISGLFFWFALHGHSLKGESPEHALIVGSVQPRPSQGEKDILAHRIIQSFDPRDNIDPELANKIGCELASKLTNGEFSFVVGKGGFPRRGYIRARLHKHEKRL